MSNYEKLTQKALSGVYTTDTFCRTIVVGYASNKIQTLKLPCYIRSNINLYTYIYGNPASIYLNGYIIARRPAKELSCFIRSICYRDFLYLSSYVRSIEYRKNKKLSSFIRMLQEKSVSKFFTGYLYTIPYVSLTAFLDVISIKYLKSYIQGTYKLGTKFLSVDFIKLFFRDYKNITSYLHGWQNVNLIINIYSKPYKDLSTLIYGFTTDLVYLYSNLYSIPFKSLNTHLHGYAKKDLIVNCTSLIAYKNLTCQLNTISYLRLLCNIKGFRGFGKTRYLYCNINQYKYKNLIGYMNITSFKSLFCFLDTSHKVTFLKASIFGGILAINEILAVSLLEKKDLYAIINNVCKSSSYTTLIAYIRSLYKYDLKTYIVGWSNDFFARNLKDLNCYIQVQKLRVESSLDLQFIVNKVPSTILDISAGTTLVKYYRFNLLPVIAGELCLLKASIYGQYRSYLLNATITVKPLPNFVNDSLGPVKLQDTIPVVNLKRFEQRTTRFVHFSFSNNTVGSPVYFYVDNYDYIYDLDNKDHIFWKIYVEGYDYSTPTDLKTNSQYNYINTNLKHHTIDSNVRYYLDKFSKVEYNTLKATISGGYYKCKHLNTHIFALYRKKWYSNLNATVNGV
jgi:hypothetical protein